MRIDERFKEEKRPVISFEIFPPKNESAMAKMDETLAILCELKPDFISVTFGAGGSHNHNRTIELAARIKNEFHVEPVVHLTCLHYSKEEIDAFAAELKRNDLMNVLALRGDHNPDIEQKNDFRHAADLAAYLKQKGDFCVGGGCYPDVHPEAESRVSDMRHLKEKVDAGTDFLVSQLFFDNERFCDFIEDTKIAGIDVPITAGIMPATNKASVDRMVTMCGAVFPERFRRITERFEDNKDALFDAGIAYATSQIIDLIARDVAGIHIYTLNNPVVARRITEGIKNLI